MYLHLVCYLFWLTILASILRATGRAEPCGTHRLSESRRPFLLYPSLTGYYKSFHEVEHLSNPRRTRLRVRRGRNFCIKRTPVLWAFSLFLFVVFVFLSLFVVCVYERLSEKIFKFNLNRFCFHHL